MFYDLPGNSVDLDFNLLDETKEAEVFERINRLWKIFVFFVLLIFYFSSLSGGDRYDWIRALILAIAIHAINLLPNYLNITGWIIAISLSLLLVSKISGQSITGSLLFLLIIDIVYFIIQ